MLSCYGKSRSATHLDDFIYNFETILMHQIKGIQSQLYYQHNIFTPRFSSRFRTQHIQLSRVSLYRINKLSRSYSLPARFSYTNFFLYLAPSFTPGPLVDSTGLFRMPFFLACSRGWTVISGAMFRFSAYLPLVRLVYKN